ncbi:MAG: transposase [Patescibacteria group bacterium]|nr:transposase [bacterium]MDZ4226888.1 transposase [Patescibacteria group bacterium]
MNDDDDKNRFLLMLAHFNDEYQPANWFRDVTDPRVSPFARPGEWPKQKKLVHIIAFCLLTNHFHLLLEETQDGGISKFMQRLGTGMSCRHNLKYEEQGSLFQGSFRSRTVDRDSYLRYVIAYIQLKNPLDMYHGKIRSAKDFEKAYAWSCKYQYASLGDHAGEFNRPIIERGALVDIFSPDEFKRFGKDFIEGRAFVSEDGSGVVYFE